MRHTAATSAETRGRGALKVFVSYKRNVEPDQTLAAQLVEHFTAAGHAVFIDLRLQVGEEWAVEIARQVREADYLVVLLTAASSASEMVRGEIEIARKAAQESGHGPRILPVRVAFFEALPYPLNAYLDRIQYASWRGPEDSSSLLRELQAVLGGAPLSSAAEPTIPRSAQSLAAPAYAAMLPPRGGAIDTDDPFYVERDVDAGAVALAASPGQTLIIKGPRQMGKSSLLVRVVDRALSAGKRAAMVDLQLLDSATRGHTERFFKWFCAAAAEQLEIGADPSAHWDPGVSLLQNCTNFVDRQILSAVNEPVMLAIDESDLAFKVPSGSDFFSMLRNWHGRRAVPTLRKWKRLDLVLVTAVEPDQYIDDPHQSPFNVGVLVRLEDFSLAQVESLNARHPKPLSKPDLDAVFRLVGGHPYLMRRALYLTAGAASRITIDQLVRTAADDLGPFGDHLRYYLLRVSRTAEVMQALREVLMRRPSSNDDLVFRLQASGLLRSDQGRVVPRCELYATYFSSKLHINA